MQVLAGIKKNPTVTLDVRANFVLQQVSISFCVKLMCYDWPNRGRVHGQFKWVKKAS